MPERTYRLNLYTPADFEAQIKSFETMAGKGWQLEDYGPHLLTYRKAEPCETHYTMTFLTEAPSQGVIASAKHLIIERALKNGWELVQDETDDQLQIFRNNRLAPLPIEPDLCIRQEQIAKMLRKKHSSGYFSTIIVFLFFILLFVSPTLNWMAILSNSTYLLLIGVVLGTLLGILLETVWTYLWDHISKKAAKQGRPFFPYFTRLRTAVRLLLFIVACLLFGTLFFTAPSPRLWAFLFLHIAFYASVPVYTYLSRRYWKKNEWIITPVFLIMLFVVFFTLYTVIQTNFPAAEPKSNLSDHVPPVTMDALLQISPDYEVFEESVSPLAAYFSYDATCKTNADKEQKRLYYDICFIDISLIRHYVVKRITTLYRMDSLSLSDKWGAEQAYGNGHINYILLEYSDRLVLLRSFPAANRDLILNALAAFNP